VREQETAPMMERSFVLFNERSRKSGEECPYDMVSRSLSPSFSRGLHRADILPAQRSRSPGSRSVFRSYDRYLAARAEWCGSSRRQAREPDGSNGNVDLSA